MKDRIRELRKSVGLTQADFGKKLGVTTSAEQKWELGAAVPSEAVIKSICREFAVNESWLRTGEGEMRIAPTREKEMSDLVRQLMAERPESFRSALITTLLRFDPDGPEWQLLENIYKKVSAEIKKDPLWVFFLMG